MLYMRTHPDATLRRYFRLERRLSEHWHMDGAASILRRMEPGMIGSGLLQAGRVQVEPRMSLFLDPRDLVPLMILRTGEWQPEVWQSMSPALGPGGVFFDVGAHIGYFSMKAAPVVGPAGLVVSFEPNPETVKLLRDNVAANHFQNVTVEPIACTDRDETLTLYAAPVVNTGASSLSRDNAALDPSNPPRAYTVRGRPIDDVVRELNLTRVDAVKVDVEGAEVQVLQGAIETLKRFHPKLVVEVVPSQLAEFHTTPEDLRNLLRGAGYVLSRPVGEQGTDVEFAARAASEVAMGDESTSIQLLRGFHGVENGWRWTAGRFEVALGVPASAAKPGAQVEFKFVIPDAAYAKTKGVTISAKAGGEALPPQTYSTPGEHVYTALVPKSSLANGIVQIEFMLDRFLPASEFGRELGVIATSIAVH
jgi:FkbM family methyltransferase